MASSRSANRRGEPNRVLGLKLPEPFNLRQGSLDLLQGLDRCVRTFAHQAPQQRVSPPANPPPRRNGAAALHFLIFLPRELLQCPQAERGPRVYRKKTRVSRPLGLLPIGQLAHGPRPNSAGQVSTETRTSTPRINGAALAARMSASRSWARRKVTLTSPASTSHARPAIEARVRRMSFAVAMRGRRRACRSRGSRPQADRRTRARRRARPQGRHPSRPAARRARPGRHRTGRRSWPPGRP